MNFSEMKKMDSASLLVEVASLKKELFNLRLSAMAGQIKDNSQFSKLRAKIAQCLTLINAGGVKEVVAKPATSKVVTTKKSSTKKAAAK
jgi:ribosomal protein L29